MLDRAQVAVRKVLRKAGLLGVAGKMYRFFVLEFLRQRVRVSAFDLKYGDRDIYEATILGKRVQFSSRDRYSKHWFFPRYEHNIHEPDVTHLFAREAQEASGIIDVGANLGWYTCIGAVLSEGTVWSVEMDPENVRRLRKNVQLNEANNVKVIHAAADDKEGAVSYNRRSGAAEYKLENGHGETSGTVNVRATTIDDMLTPTGAIDLVKIDVEGAELRVLQGATRTMETMKPKIIVEVRPSRLSSQRGSVEAITNLLSEKGYKMRTSENAALLQGETSQGNPENEGIFTIYGW